MTKDIDYKRIWEQLYCWLHKTGVKNPKKTIKKYAKHELWNACSRIETQINRSEFILEIMENLKNTGRIG